MPPHRRRAACHTVLLVGEGTTEWAFLKHIKALYLSRGCGVSAAIRNAHGKGPDHVVDYAIRQCRNAAYDRVVVLLDTDLTMSAAVRRRVKSRKIHVIGSTPCVEGLLLRILGERVPGNSAACKAQYGRALPARLTAPKDYQTHFPKDVLDGQRADVSELDELLKCLLFDK